MDAEVRARLGEKRVKTNRKSREKAMGPVVAKLYDRILAI